MKKKHDIVQIKNPKSNRYTKIDRSTGEILSRKQSKGPYKNIPIARITPDQNPLCILVWIIAKNAGPKPKNIARVKPRITPS